MMEIVYVYGIVILVGLSFSLFNVFTLFVTFSNRKLRKRLSSYPVVSFLVASMFQGLIAAPVYIYRQLVFDEYTQVWTCNVYRYPYIYCGHMMKLSLMLVSLDRMASVKCPFRYTKESVKCYVILVLALTWTTVALVDSIPFVNGVLANSACSYIPNKYWGIVVIATFDILPFVVIVINYSIIWTYAAKFSFEEKNRRESLQSQNYLSTSSNSVYKLTNDDCDETQPLSKGISAYGSLNETKSASTLTVSNIKHLVDLRATKVSLILLATYLLCWGPLGSFYMIDHFCDACLSSQGKNQTVRMVMKLLNFASSVFAPIAYCWWNTEYRKTAKKILKPCCCQNCNRPESGEKRDISPLHKTLRGARHFSRKPRLSNVQETSMIDEK